jgi:hypothetical protein
MHHAFAVAMQVQHDVGVMGQGEQGLAHALQLGGGLPLGQVLGHGGAHRAHVGGSIGAQLALDGRQHFFAEVRVVAVEVLRAVELKAAHGLVVQALGQAYGVGDRHQHHLTGELARRLGRFQQRAQVVGGEHAGQFLSMQAGLDVDL